MEVESTTRDLHYDFMNHITETLLTDKSHEISTIPINHG